MTRWTLDHLDAYRTRRKQEAGAGGDEVVPKTYGGFVPAPADPRRRMLTLSLPLPPSANNLYRPGGAEAPQAKFLTDEHKAYRQAVAEIVALRKVEPPFLGAVALEVLMFGGGLDVDNGNKGLLDALQHAGVFPNDRQVEDLRVRRIRMEEGGGVRPGLMVTITEV